MDISCLDKKRGSSLKTAQLSCVCLLSETSGFPVSLLSRSTLISVFHVSQAVRSFHLE